MTTENAPIKKYESLCKGLGIAGLVTGILTLLFSFIPCFGVFAFIFGILAVIISVVALIFALKHNHSKGLIIAALVTALLGCAISLTQSAALFSAADEMQKIQMELDNQ